MYIGDINKCSIKAYIVKGGTGRKSKGEDAMKTMIVREDSRGRKTYVKAQKTYRTDSGEWVVEIDGKEFRRACSYVCKGVKNCVWEDLHVQADLDDDGKEYKVLSN